MYDWKQQIAKCNPIIFYDDNKPYKTTDYFGYDGFLPEYYSQELKLLFIGRESRANSKSDSVINTIDHFKNVRDINSSSFWRRILYIVYGVKNHGKIDFSELPYAQDIALEMVKCKNYGFALMNISKYSNDRVDGGKADKKLINRFLEDSELGKRNFIKEEIEMLEPDIIITANLWDGKIKKEYLDICFSNMKLIRKIDDKLNIYRFNNKNKEIPIFDLWHFSRPGSDKVKYYDPVMNALYGK